MSNVVELDVVTRLDIPAEKILRKALDADLAEVVVIGFGPEGEYFFAASKADGADVLWLLELTKHELFVTADMISR